MSQNPSLCPLCGGLNDCQMCSVAIYKGPCWCMKVKIPEELIAQLPAESRNRTCICRACVMKFHRSKTGGAPAPKVLPGDFYFDGGLMVFTEVYHLRRGYCCDSGCRHCPFKVATNPFAFK
ncbi:MAG TPA: cysteine-rich CWC family protein [Verrucomicrobiae bacterium]|nr:cysteine-rich CWC family protein [Verrucomicrobiae bacterium]